MKYRSVLLKSLVMVLAFAVLLSVCISLLSYSNIGTRNSEDFNTPEINTNTVNAPLSQRQLQKKYNKYNTVTEENGKSVVTIFSEEQITDFNTRRNGGEWFWLTSEEMLFLINDTVELFKTYDIVYIRDLDGNLNKYYGLSFFSSEEYYASFGGTYTGNSDASFNLNLDMYETIFKRMEALNSAIYKTVDYAPIFEYIVISDIETPISAYEANMLQNMKNPWFEMDSDGNDMHFHALEFLYNGKIEYYENIESTDQTIERKRNVYPDRVVPETISLAKYDRTGRTVVIEVYEEQTQKLVFRIRLDEKNNPQKIEEIQLCFDEVFENFSGSNESMQTANYRAIIYLNGFQMFGEPDAMIVYCPDGNLDMFSILLDTRAIFTNNRYFPDNGKPLTEYINKLLAEYSK